MAKLSLALLLESLSSLFVSLYHSLGLNDSALCLSQRVEATRSQSFVELCGRYFTEVIIVQDVRFFKLSCLDWQFRPSKILCKPQLAQRLDAANVVLYRRCSERFNIRRVLYQRSWEIQYLRVKWGHDPILVFYVPIVLWPGAWGDRCAMKACLLYACRATTWSEMVRSRLS